MQYRDWDTSQMTINSLLPSPEEMYNCTINERETKTSGAFLVKLVQIFAASWLFKHCLSQIRHPFIPQRKAQCNSPRSNNPLNKETEKKKRKAVLLWRVCFFFRIYHQTSRCCKDSLTAPWLWCGKSEGRISQTYRILWRLCTVSPTLLCFC